MCTQMKHDRSIKKVSTHLDVLHFPAPVEKTKDPSCLNCSSPLSLSQPDLDMPDRLLGICEHCKNWFLIDIVADQGEGTMVRLPEAQVIRTLARATDKKMSK